MLLSTIILPFINFFFLFLFKNFLNKKTAIKTTIYYITSLLVLIILNFYYNFNKVTLIKIKKWFNVNYLTINFEFLFDNLTLIMLFIIIFISFLVHIYSFNYMINDKNFIKFLSFLSLFTGFMILFVSSNNFIMLFFGWEGVGLCSFLLINFWTGRSLANKSGLKSILVNKISDIFLLIGIIIILNYSGTLKFSIVFTLIPYLFSTNIYIFNNNFFFIDLVSFFLFIGVTGKSAQIGLHIWLPDAMEGPTPVSALIHAATMVTAGIFILIRCSFIFEYSNNILLILIFFGLITALSMSFIGCFQNDLKKIVAYSTCSQLGYMVTICGFSYYNISLFHLCNHSFFKALLFLSSGYLIHFLNNEQNIKVSSNLYNFIPLFYAFFLIGSLSLMGIPFLTGFYSKDFILEILFLKTEVHSLFVYWVLLIGTFLTSIYSYKIFYFLFFKNSIYLKKLPSLNNKFNLLLFVLLVLSIFSIFFGYFFIDLFLGVGNTTFNNIIYYNLNNKFCYEVEFIPFYIKFLPFIFTIISLLVFKYLFNNKIIKLKFIKTYFFNSNIILYILNLFYFKLFFDSIINIFVNVFYKKFCIINKYIDKGFLEILGPYGISFILIKLSTNLLKKKINYFYNIIFVILFYFTFLLIYFI